MAQGQANQLPLVSEQASFGNHSANVRAAARPERNTAPFGAKPYFPKYVMADLMTTPQLPRIRSTV